MIKKIYLDMDGVICNFEKKVAELNAYKINAKGEQKVNWDLLDSIGSSVWSTIEWIPEGKELYNYLVPFCHKHNLELGILSALYLPNGKKGKKEWLAKNCPNIKVENINIIDNGLSKYKYGGKDVLLIDDNPEVCAKYAKIGPVSRFERNPLHNYYEAILNYYLV